MMTHANFPPLNTTDCHTHVAGDGVRYPFVSPRAYTPAIASPTDMRQMMDHTGVDRIVLVQMSVYGTDNRYMLEGLRALGDCARGVVQIDDSVSSSGLDSLHAHGVRGVRINLNTTGMNDPLRAARDLEMAGEKCARNGWHLQLFTTPSVIAQIEDVLHNLPVPVVFDHFGLLPVRRRHQAAETIICDLLAQGKAWVKISGTYRLDHPNADPEIADLARDLYAAGRDYIVWGSDWPHTPVHANAAEADPAPLPYRDINPSDMLRKVQQIFDAPADQARILVDNPARLYGF